MSDDEELVYRRRERLADRWRGRRDGRRRHPAYSDLVAMADDERMITAPHPESLIRQSLRRMETELVRFEARTAGDRATLARLRSELAAAAVGLERGTAAVARAEAELDEAELRPRNHTELLPENRAVLLSRRDEMRNRRIAAARGEEAAQFAALNALAARIEAVKEQIRTEFVLAQNRARWEGAHCAVRVAAYWEHVVLVHPEGTYLTPLLRFAAQELPSWVTTPPDADPADLGRGPFESHRVAQRLETPPRLDRRRRRTGRLYRADHADLVDHPDRADHVDGADHPDRAGSVDTEEVEGTA
ncbi:hypothetical protein [Saccharothrix variisporea]|uniref:Uncharacterized protein n=1 Tax=Saccharothrix variisporea TaxID=543527 RepID=A0A495XCS0_9PSEU|nr:hypothetical protein [Saccharothrix variisporea]RKT70895.1 hypothetical protein DFJ66_4172 [Saccharothrix variisporea]